MNVALRDVGLIAWRSSRRTMRQPAAVIVPLIFPLILLAVNSNGLKAATHIPGFPTNSFLAFFLPFAFIQGALFAAMTAGTDLARDIDTGFFNRLALTPLRGTGPRRRPARRRARAGASPGDRLPRGRARSSACTSRAAPPGILVLRRARAH